MRKCLDPEPQGFIGSFHMEVMTGVDLEYKSSQQFIKGYIEGNASLFQVIGTFCNSLSQELSL